MTELNSCVVCGLVSVVGLFLFVVIVQAGSRSPMIDEDPLEEEAGYYWMMLESERHYDGEMDD